MAAQQPPDDSPLHGDVLDSVVSHIPSADLVAAALVSRDWEIAVRRALLREPRRRLWLLLHVISVRGCHVGSLAFDPHSATWLRVPVTRRFPRCRQKPHILRSCAGDRLYCEGVALSGDPFGVTWTGVTPPCLPRYEPIAAAVGHRVVLIGGEQGYVTFDEPLPEVAEILDGVGGGTWIFGMAMPVSFGEKPSAGSLSAAATATRVYIVSRGPNCVGNWFDPSTGEWAGPGKEIQPNPNVSEWSIAAGHGERVVLFGAQRDVSGMCAMVRVWVIDGETMEALDRGGRGGEMPLEMSARLFESREDNFDGEMWTLRMGVCGVEGGGYVYDLAAPTKGAVLYELSPEAVWDADGDIVARWEWVAGTTMLEDEARMGTVVVGCSPVNFDDLVLAMTSPAN